MQEKCGSVRVGETNPKRVWRNDEVKAAVRRKEAAREGMLAAKMKRQKKDAWKRTERKRKMLKWV